MTHWNNTLQNTQTNCNTLQHTTTHCNTLYYTLCYYSKSRRTVSAVVRTLKSPSFSRNRHAKATLLSRLRVRGKRGEGGGVRAMCNILQHCNTLQHTATLQHKATLLSRLRVSGSNGEGGGVRAMWRASLCLVPKVRDPTNLSATNSIVSKPAKGTERKQESKQERKKAT